MVEILLPHSVCVCVESGFYVYVISHITTGARGRSKKWKEIMRLPLVAHVLYLRNEIGGLIDAV